MLPSAAPLIGMFCFGNLMRESLVVERLSEVVQNSLINIVTIFLGLAVGSKLAADQFLTPFERDYEEGEVFIVGAAGAGGPRARRGDRVPGRGRRGARGVHPEPAGRRRHRRPVLGREAGALEAVRGAAAETRLCRGGLRAHADRHA